MDITIEEYNTSNSSQKATYILKSDGTLTMPANRRPRSSSFTTRVFLPEGWPHSVTPDYAWFQIWDTIQALCSYIRGMLTTHALLIGVGVGKDTATPWSAALQFFLKDFMGMLGGVAFAALHGGSFDGLAKQWRLTADIANDVGLTLELVAPWFDSPGIFLALACLGSLCRAITGVAGSATRFALTQHFALERNAADIAAKESSQETATTLLGMLCGVGLTRLSSVNQPAALVAFCIITVLHIWANVKAMRCLQLSTLNRPRLDILLADFTSNRQLTIPAEMSLIESLMPPPLAWLLCVLHLRPAEPRITIAPSLAALDLPSISGQLEKALSARQRYCVLQSSSKKEAIVLLHKDADAVDIIQGYSRASSLLLASNQPEQPDKQQWNTVFIDALRGAGWQLESVALMQGSNRVDWERQTVTKTD